MNGRVLNPQEIATGVVIVRPPVVPLITVTPHGPCPACGYCYCCGRYGWRSNAIPRPWVWTTTCNHP